MQGWCTPRRNRVGQRLLAAQADPERGDVARPGAALADGRKFLNVAVPDNRHAKADRLLIDVCLAPFRTVQEVVPIGAYAGKHTRVLVRRDLARILACQADNGADVSVVDEHVLRENFPSVVISASRTPNDVTLIAGSSNPIGEADL